MKIYTDKRLLRCGLIGGTVSRHSGNMRDPANQTAVFEELGLPPKHMLHLHQVHGDELISIHRESEARKQASAPLADADGWLLAPFPAGWGCTVVTADCVPVFIWSADGQQAALAHCGWRGVVKGLAAKAARALGVSAPGAQMQAWLGPHIQACCFEVQPDVADQFEPDCVHLRNGKLFVDLTAAIICQLQTAGIDKRAIHAPYYCTCGDRENFFSWRRDHQKNLLLSFLYRP